MAALHDARRAVQPRAGIADALPTQSVTEISDALNRVSNCTRVRRKVACTRELAT